MPLLYPPGHPWSKVRRETVVGQFYVVISLRERIASRGARGLHCYVAKRYHYAENRLAGPMCYNSAWRR